ncbi:hypothetical protein IMY05_019G0071700 [Salix suchowensis]|nr:hypothetical protein IMY05_019G0071700 [Salix suchowensis]
MPSIIVCFSQPKSHSDAFWNIFKKEPLYYRTCSKPMKLVQLHPSCFSSNRNNFSFL